MFKDPKFVVVLLIAVVAIVVAGVEANQLGQLKDQEAGLQREATACKETMADLQGQLANMTASLNQLQSDYEALKAEHEKLKGRRGSSGKAAPKR